MRKTPCEWLLVRRLVVATCKHRHCGKLSMGTRRLIPIANTQHTAHSTQHTAHSTQHTAHRTPHTAHSTQHTATQHTATQHTAHSTQHTAHSTQHTAHSTQHTAHNTRHTTHDTRHTTPHHNTPHHTTPHQVSFGTQGAFFSDPSGKTAILSSGYASTSRTWPKTLALRVVLATFQFRGSVFFFGHRKPTTRSINHVKRLPRARVSAAASPRSQPRVPVVSVYLMRGGRETIPSVGMLQVQQGRCDCAGHGTRQHTTPPHLSVPLGADFSRGVSWRWRFFGWVGGPFLSRAC